MNLPKHLHRITVFGERLEAVDVFEEVGPETVVLYKNLNKPKDKPKAATMDDWIEWNENAKASKK